MTFVPSKRQLNGMSPQDAGHARRIALLGGQRWAVRRALDKGHRSQEMEERNKDTGPTASSGKKKEKLA